MFRSQPSPSAWILGLQCQLSGLVAGVFTCKVISLYIYITKTSSLRTKSKKIKSLQIHT